MTAIVTVYDQGRTNLSGGLGLLLAAAPLLTYCTIPPTALCMYHVALKLVIKKNNIKKKKNKENKKHGFKILYNKNRTQYKNTKVLRSIRVWSFDSTSFKY